MYINITCMKQLNLSFIRIVIQSLSLTNTLTAFQRIIEDKLFDLKYPSSQRYERNNIMYLYTRYYVVRLLSKATNKGKLKRVSRYMSLDIVNSVCGSLRASTLESVEVNGTTIKAFLSLLRLLLRMRSYIDTLIISNMSEQMSSSSVSIFLLQLWIRLSFSASPCHDIRSLLDIQTQR